MDQDVVFSRLLDGRGKAADWQALRDLTLRDAAQWERLIGSAGDQDLLSDAVAMAGTRAETCEAMEAAPAPLAFPSASGPRADRAVRAARLGWLVAACLALGLVSVAVRPREAAPTGAPQTAGLVNLDKLSSSTLMDTYKDRATKEGTLVAELPQRTVIETRPSPDGKGYEVLFMRQFIERAIVDDLYKMGCDDAGRPVMVPTSLPKNKPAGAM